MSDCSENNSFGFSSFHANTSSIRSGFDDFTMNFSSTHDGFLSLLTEDYRLQSSPLNSTTQVPNDSSSLLSVDNLVDSDFWKPEHASPDWDSTWFAADWTPDDFEPPDAREAPLASDSPSGSGEILRRSLSPRCRPETTPPSPSLTSSIDTPQGNNLRRCDITRCPRAFSLKFYARRGPVRTIPAELQTKIDLSGNHIGVCIYCHPNPCAEKNSRLFLYGSCGCVSCSLSQQGYHKLTMPQVACEDYVDNSRKFICSSHHKSEPQRMILLKGKICRICKSKTADQAAGCGKLSTPYDKESMSK